MQSPLIVTMELSLYPLADPGAEVLEAPIIEFIQALQRFEALELRVNAMSTQLRGPYGQVMAALTDTGRTLLAREQPFVLVSKLINRPLAIEEAPRLG